MQEAEIISGVFKELCAIELTVEQLKECKADKGGAAAQAAALQQAFSSCLMCCSAACAVLPQQAPLPSACQASTALPHFGAAHCLALLGSDVLLSSNTICSEGA